jgi:hypothetical protein
VRVAVPRDTTLEAITGELTTEDYGIPHGTVFESFTIAPDQASNNIRASVFLETITPAVKGSSRISHWFQKVGEGLISSDGVDTHKALWELPKHPVPRQRETVMHIKLYNETGENVTVRINWCYSYETEDFDK